MIGVDIGYTIDSKNVINKTFNKILELEGVIKNDTSIINPSIIIECNITDIRKANYLHIPAFGRYYYINNIKSVNNNIVEIGAHVDVLKSFSSDILDNTAIVSRQQKKYNLYLQDGVFKTYANPNYEIRKFPNGFTNDYFILSVVGG